MSASTSRPLDVPGAPPARTRWRAPGPTLLLVGHPIGRAGGVRPRSCRALQPWTHTVVTYDPRGFARSTIDDPDQDAHPDLLADDARRVLASVGPGSRRRSSAGRRWARVTGLAPGGPVPGRRRDTRRPRAAARPAAARRPRRHSAGNARDLRHLPPNERDRHSVGRASPRSPGSAGAPSPGGGTCQSAGALGRRGGDERALLLRPRPPAHRASTAGHRPPCEAAPTRLIVAEGCGVHRASSPLAHGRGAGRTPGHGADGVCPGVTTGFISEPEACAAVLRRALD